MKLYTKRSNLISLRNELDQLNNSDFALPELHSLLNVFNSFNSFQDDDEYIRFQIFSIIAYHSGYEVEEIEPSQNLKFNLGINNTEKWIFRRKFNELIHELGGNKFTSKTECVNCTFVQDCLDLVKSKLEE